MGRASEGHSLRREDGPSFHPAQEQAQNAPRNMMEEGGKADSEADPAPALSILMSGCFSLGYMKRSRSYSSLVCTNLLISAHWHCSHTGQSSETALLSCISSSSRTTPGSTGL